MDSYWLRMASVCKPCDPRPSTDAEVKVNSQNASVPSNAAAAEGEEESKIFFNDLAQHDQPSSECIIREPGSSNDEESLERNPLERRA